MFGTFNKALPVLKFAFPDGRRIVPIADCRFQFIDDPLSGCFATKPLVSRLILRLQIACECQQVASQDPRVLLASLRL
jgi:hypothetical protein